VSIVLMAIPTIIARKLCDTISIYAIRPTAAGTKNTAMFLVMTVAVLRTFSGLMTLKNKARKSNIMPITLPGIKP